MNNAQHEKVSDEPTATARKSGAQIEADILRRLAEVTQVEAAKCMGVHPSTVSRMTEDITRLSQLLAALGLKVADKNSMEVSQAEIDALECIAYKYFRMKQEGSQ